MKRTPKSFTVEIRSSSRKKAPSRAIQTARATLTPRVAFVPDEEASKPWMTARVLPALEPSQPLASPVLDGPADIIPLEHEDTNIEWEEDVIAAEPDERTSDLVMAPVEPMHAIRPVMRIIPKRAAKPGLPRQAFGRAERWKHRLPKVMQKRAAKRAP